MTKVQRVRSIAPTVAGKRAPTDSVLVDQSLTGPFVGLSTGQVHTLVRTAQGIIREAGERLTHAAALCQGPEAAELKTKLEALVAEWRGLYRELQRDATGAVQATASALAVFDVWLTQREAIGTLIDRVSATAGKVAV